MKEHDSFVAAQDQILFRSPLSQSMAAFAVEVPGEAAPLSETAVESCLRAATSRHAHQIQSGTKQLQNWSTQAGYYSHLQVKRRLPIFRDSNRAVPSHREYETSLYVSASPSTTESTTVEVMSCISRFF